MYFWELSIIITISLTLFLTFILIHIKDKEEDGEEEKLNLLIIGIKGKMGSFLADNLADYYNIYGLDPSLKETTWPCARTFIEALNYYPDLILDFSGIKGYDNLCFSLKEGIPVVSGSTGYNEEQIEALVNLTRKMKTSLIMSANFSEGFTEIADFISNLNDYEIKITEEHHKSKIDRPSGSSKILAKILNYDESKIEVIRGESFTPKHTIELKTMGEKILITHEITHRTAYLKNIKAALDDVYQYSIIEINGMPFFEDKK